MCMCVYALLVNCILTAHAQHNACVSLTVLVLHIISEVMFVKTDSLSVFRFCELNC